MADTLKLCPICELAPFQHPSGQNCTPSPTRELRSVLIDAKLQLEYLDEKFPSTGTTQTVLARIRAALGNKGE